jgi:hypothetical protein
MGGQMAQGRNFQFRFHLAVFRVQILQIRITNRIPFNTFRGVAGDFAA